MNKAIAIALSIGTIILALVALEECNKASQSIGDMNFSYMEGEL